MTKAKKCGGALHYEVVSGMRVFREANGQKVYKARCSVCHLEVYTKGRTKKCSLRHDPEEIKLEAGTYKLTGDVVNPTRDARFKAKWWLRRVLKAGEVFQIEDRTDAEDGFLRIMREDKPNHFALDPHGFQKKAEKLRYQVVSPLKGGIPQKLSTPLGQAMAAFLVTKEMELNTLLDLLEREHYVDPRWLLGQLIEDGKITLDDIQKTGESRQRRVLKSRWRP